MASASSQDAAAVFDPLRPGLVRVAYRMLGSVRSHLVRYGLINGLPGFVTIERGDILQTTALEVEREGVVAIYVVRNPDKLRHMADTVH